ncbi:MAG: hypothetical protein A3H14_03845 [Candidatus Doudnabacteria bacterium RIFCSPLOWO2_12_FULL_49_8]|nr:MAG: hypothetical protein A3H14_03845 [Candidatus Doudnabacteria bacterium RIFCSPLOWO2_12_FULL_49_8]
MRFYAIIMVLFVAVFGLGYGVGEGRVKLESGKLNISKGSVATSADYSLLWEALDAVNGKYVDRPLDQQKLLYGAVDGMVAATGDPYTTFFDPEEAKQFTEDLRGFFSGIGAQIGMKDKQIVVIAPLDGTPAQKAGIAPGDAILAINGETTEGMAVDVAVTKIRGPIGTKVTLKILPKDQNEAKDVTITRAKIEIKSVKLETKEVNGPAAAGGTSKKIAVIKLSEFGEDTKGLLDQAVGTITTGNYSGVILDLRNNPGGYLDTAVTTISNWIDADKVAVKEIGYNKKENDYKTAGLPRLKGMKTVVLVNGGSASASEIVSGALQDYKVATLVGEKTFGKGSVQELQDLKGNTEIKITVAKWFTPKGRGIDKTGLEPDINVELTADDIKNEKDPQMDKAMELLGK